MEEALIKIGLPVKCRKCRKEGRVRPHNYGGWYKSKLLRMKSDKWFCPEHAKIGEDMDNRFYERYRTPDPQSKSTESLDELYKILD